jgi:ribosome maturation factor RimP
VAFVLPLRYNKALTGMGTKVPIFNMTNFEKISEMLSEFLVDTDFFVVDTKVSPTNNFKFSIDSDSGFGINESVKLSRQLRKRIDELEMFPDGNYSMELGSPGIDAPLKLARQYVKNLERLVLVTFLDKDTKAIEGRLKEFSEDSIVIEVTDKKKKTTTLQTIQHVLCKSVVVQIEF